jgi:hypothetical protein
MSDKWWLSPLPANKHRGWDYLNYLLQRNIEISVLLKTAAQLERELNAFTTAIQEAAWNSTPVIKTTLNGPNCTKEIKNLIAEKRKPRRKWHQSRNPHVKISWNESTINYSRKSETSNKQTDKQTPWLLVRMRTITTNSRSATHQKTRGGRWTRNNVEKANTFAHHLEKTFHPNSGLYILPVPKSKDYLDKILLKNGVFWDVTPCGSCKNRRFGGTWRLLHQDDKNRWTRKNTSCN